MVIFAPVPVSGTICGLPVALSVIVREPLSGPVMVGTNLTVIEQWAPATSEVPQPFDCVKSPLATMLVNVRVEVPVLVSVTDFDELVVLICWRLKVRLVGDKLTVVVPELAPVPVRPTTCGLPAALSVIVIVPVCVPVAVGVKVTLIEQFAPAASEAPQVVVSPYCALGTMLLMLSDAVPELVSVTDCAALVVFNVWLAKVRLVGDNDTAGLFGAAPVPVRFTVWGLPVALSVMVMEPV